MSKIGKITISIPDKVKVVLAGNIINIEGPLGKKSIGIDLEMFNLDIKEGKEISIKPKKVDQNSKRLWGMNRSLINNAVIGSSTGYEKILELVGVGYRAALKGNQLNLQLGYSHDISYDIPDGIEIEVEKQTTLKISGSDKQQVGSVASKIKTLEKCNDGMSPEDIQTLIYSAGKENGYADKLRDWFKLIYEVVFGEENGPRMGFFISFFGVNETKELITNKLK